ncbi:MULTISPECIES: iron chaperone [Citricoccus]|uniref:iron chaperone n=1 Tax=Citricoccus TaxID=169133 RepID=UPI000255E113|nr:DUF1801 domain-containing protein [Citricoccus sp. CH26A]
MGLLPKSMSKAAGDRDDVLRTIAGMDARDRAVAERIHAIVTEVAPDLTPRLMYGQPGYYRDGTVVCFFRSGAADKARYSTLGFDEGARFEDEDSGFWPTSFALTRLTPQAEDEIRALVRRAAG